jgi:hypothetical protein
MPRGKRTELARRRRRLFALLDECLAELRPDLVADAVTELRNVVSSLAMGAADQESGLDDDARIEFLVAAGWTLIDVAARSDAGRRAVGAPVSGA